MAKILHVEDDPIMLTAIARILRKHNYEVISASDGKVAFEILENNKDFDLIISDLMLPYSNGIEILQKVKTDPELRDIPVIVISSVGNEEMIKSALNSGAEDFIKKPIMAGELIVRISKLLKKKEENNSKNNFLVTKKKK
jgi:DNA-binding response OmpR family regulator